MDSAKEKKGPTIAQQKIIDMVALYLAYRHTAEPQKELAGTMPQIKYFILYDRITEMCSYGTTRQKDTVVRGTLIDVIADAIERKEFFGDYVGEIIENVASPSAGNTKLRVLDEHDEIRGTVPVKIIDGEIYPVFRDVEHKSYLDALRTPDGFIQTARQIARELNPPAVSNLEQIAREIYS